MKRIDWIDPWEAAPQPADGLSVELQKEVPPAHPLYRRSAEAVGHRIDCDDVLFRLDDGTFVVVHLTWSGKQDHHPGFPSTTFYDSVDDFIQKAMLPDAEDYGAMA